MTRQYIFSLSRQFKNIRSYSAPSKVAVLGAAGGIGQPLSLLLKNDKNSNIRELALYDIANMGMAADLSHIPTTSKVHGFSGKDQIEGALKGADVVIIPAGVPRKPGMTRDDLFNINASIVKGLVAECALHCPNAALMVISNPVNSTVPIAYETMKGLGVENPKIYGVTTLDLIRAKAFIGEIKNVDPDSVNVKVIGGHSGPTIVPLLSGAGFEFGGEETKTLIQRIQYGGDEVVKAKDGGGSATLSMASAAKTFFDAFMSALGDQSQKITAFIKCPNYPSEFFATEFSLKSDGSIRDILPFDQIKFNSQESILLKTASKDLNANIKKGQDFCKSEAPATTKA